MADETDNKPKRKYMKRSGEFNDLSLADMEKKVAELTGKLTALRAKLKAGNLSPEDTAKFNAELKEILHARVRAYTRIKKITPTPPETPAVSEAPKP